MDASRKEVLKQTGLIAIGQLVGTALMIGVYLLLQKFEMKVIWGALAGNLLAIGNFFFMAIIAVMAADRAEKQDVAGGQKLVKASYPLRFLVLAGILALCAWKGQQWFDLLAMVIPLAFVHITAMLVGFFKKKGA